jgi:hypothetical protein
MAQSPLSTAGRISFKASVANASCSPLANRSPSGKSSLLAPSDHAAGGKEMDVGHLW